MTRLDFKQVVDMLGDQVDLIVHTSVGQMQGRWSAVTKTLACFTRVETSTKGRGTVTTRTFVSYDQIIAVACRDVEP